MIDQLINFVLEMNNVKFTRNVPIGKHNADFFLVKDNFAIFINNPAGTRTANKLGIKARSVSTEKSAEKFLSDYLEKPDLSQPANSPPVILSKNREIIKALYKTRTPYRLFPKELRKYQVDIIFGKTVILNTSSFFQKKLEKRGFNVIDLTSYPYLTAQDALELARIDLESLQTKNTD